MIISVVSRYDVDLPINRIFIYILYIYQITSTTRKVMNDMYKVTGAETYEFRVEH